MITEDDMFNYIKTRYVPDLVKSNQYDSWDCKSTQNRMVIELKARRNHYHELLIEKSKYEALLLAASRSTFTAWYINATPEGIWAFNLSKLNKPKWIDRPMPKTTDFADNKQLIKQVGYLRILDGLQML